MRRGTNPTTRVLGRVTKARTTDAPLTSILRPEVVDRGKPVALGILFSSKPALGQVIRPTSAKPLSRGNRSYDCVPSMFSDRVPPDAKPLCKSVPVPTVTDLQKRLRMALCYWNVGIVLSHASHEHQTLDQRSAAQRISGLHLAAGESVAFPKPPVRTPISRTSRRPPQWRVDGRTVRCLLEVFTHECDCIVRAIYICCRHATVRVQQTNSKAPRPARIRANPCPRCRVQSGDPHASPLDSPPGTRGIGFTTARIRSKSRARRFA